MMKKRWLMMAILAVFVVAGGAGFIVFDESADASLALTELDVKKITCGSCVGTISDALLQLDGVENVEVSVTTGRGQVTFDPTKVTAGRIADTVTGAGYPARVTGQLSPEQYHALRAETERLSEIYVAKIGSRLLSRDEFSALIDQRMAAAGLSDQPEARDRVVSQAWPELTQRILLLEAAARNNVVVQDGEVELRIRKLKQQHPDLDDSIRTRFGSLDNFQRQVKEDMIINRNIEEYVLVDSGDPGQRKARFNKWFQETVINMPIEIYDAQLKQLTSVSGEGCGGGCCSKS